MLTPLLLMLAIGGLLYEAWIFAVYQHVRSDQTGVFFGTQLVVEQVSTASPLRIGDIILKINDLDVNANLITPFYRLRGYAAQNAQGAVYTILRDGAEQRVYVPWRTYQALPLLWRGGALWLVGMVMNVVALILITGKQHDKASRVISLTFIMGGLNQINNLIRTASANMALAWAWFFIPIDAISAWLSFSLLLHTLLLFPEVKAPLKRFPRLPWLIHLATPVVAVGVSLLRGGTTFLSRRHAMFGIANPLMLMQLGLGMVAIGHTYLTGRRPGVRNQIRWLIWGLILALTPWMLFYVLPSSLFNMTWLPLSFINLSLLLVPISFMISIFRFRLMDVDRVINRTLVYVLMGSVLVLVYFLVFLVSRDLLPQVDGYPNHFGAGVIATAVLFIVFNPLRIYTQHFVNRALFKRELDFSKILREVGQQLATTIFQDDVYGLLTHTIAQRLGLTGVHILLPDKTSQTYTNREQTISVPFDSPIVTWLRQNADALILHDQRRLPAEIQEAIQPLVKAGIEIGLALLQHNNLLGLYLVGVKCSGDLFTRDEVNNLVLLSQQAAAVISNAQLYETLQEYSRSLEGHVMARTAELLAERDRLNIIIQNITDGLVVTDSQGNISLVNAAFCNIVNRAAEQIVGKPSNVVLPSPQFAQLIASASLHPGQVQTQTFTVAIVNSRSYDTYRIYKASACALVPRGSGDGDTGGSSVSGVVTVIQDVTHEQEVDRMKTEFISMVSHELRTPLTSVLGFSKLIQRIFDQEIIPRLTQADEQGQGAIRHITENLKIIGDEGDRLTRLINDVLDITKMEAGKVEWRVTDASFQEIIDTAVNALRAISLQRHIPILVETQALPLTVPVDRDRMIQVMTNLLSNALKFTQEGQVTIHARYLEGANGTLPPTLRGLAMPADHAAWLWVSVQDTGVGIPAEKLPQVFEKFEQIRNPLSQQTHGTGLGLPICREIIKQHGGHIWVESKPEVGSTFHFAIPFEKPTAATKVTPPSRFSASPEENL